jgi:hypothetical protein
MSESVEDQRGGAGEGRCRRRLTLAPRLRAGMKAKVSKGVFADSGGDKGVEAATSDVSSAEEPASFACSSVGSSSELVVRFIDAMNESRFWALGLEEDSEDEAPAPPTEPSAASGVSVQGTEQLSVSAMRCKEESRVRPVQRPKLARRLSLYCKPWKGPIPLASYARA